MKRFLTVSAILALALIMAMSAFAAGNDAPKVIQPGDVNADGEINIEDAVLLAQYLAGWDVELGEHTHKVVIDEAVEPTCKSTGLTEGKHCSKCGMVLVKQQVVPATGHDYEDTVIPPTETEKGYTLHKCKNCGDEYNDAYTNATLAKGLEYEIANGVCTITGIGTCSETELYIPDTIENCNVTAIADKAFSEQTQLTKVILPKYIKTLGQRSFYGCTGLTEFTVPESVTSVGHQIFYKCDNLATVYYNSSFSPDQDKVFLNISSIKTVVFGGTTVPYSICYNCTNIEKVEILDTVKKSYSYAFYGCTGLKEVTIGNNVTSMGENAFYGCSSLASVEIPDSVTRIGYNSFNGCSSLASIEIPDSVTSIGIRAFYNCSSLASVTIGNSVTSIGNDAFYSCSSLKNLHISDLESWLNVKLNNYNSHPLYSADGNLYIDGVLATDIEIPDTVSSIGNYAFFNCDSIKNVKIPDSVTSIGSSAFEFCSRLKTVYYGGSAENWGDIGIASGNSYLTNATRYYYSATAPTTSGNYWHYVDGKPTPW